MVGPIPEADRRGASRRLAVGFVLLVGLSAALTAVYGGATPIEIAGVTLAGLATGAVVLVALGIRP